MSDNGHIILEVKQNIKNFRLNFKEINIFDFMQYSKNIICFFSDSIKHLL